MAKKRYPTLSLWRYVDIRLKGLAKWGYVKRLPDGTYEISEELDY